MGNAAAKGLPFVQGPAVAGYRFRSSLTVFDGTGTGQSATPTSAAVDRVLLFRFDKRSPAARPGDLDLAQNALKRLRMLRHPSVLKYIVRVVWALFFFPHATKRSEADLRTGQRAPANARVLQGTRTG